MLRRGPDTDPKPRRRFGPEAGEVDPFPRDPAPVTHPAAPAALGGWAAPASYLSLEPEVVAEIIRASLSARGVAALRSGEVAVGAMLASLAIQGEDVLLDEVLPMAVTEVRLHRYAVGQLTPLSVHPVTSLARLLRTLSWCAANPPGESWEAVAHDGANEPVAIASARHGELRWLQPPPPGQPHSSPWSALTTHDAPPGSTADWWARALSAQPEPPAGAAPAVLADSISSPIGPMFEDPIGVSPFAPPAVPTSVAPTAAAAATAPTEVRLVYPDRLPEQVLTAIAATVDGSLATSVPEPLLTAIGAVVDRSLSSALLELELDPATLDELRDSSSVERLAEAVARIEQQLTGLDFVVRQLQALTTAVDELTDSARSLMRHQWDNAPPQGFWTRMQRADDEVRRSVDELSAEVRGRFPRSGRSAS